MKTFIQFALMGMTSLCQLSRAADWSLEIQFASQAAPSHITDNASFMAFERGKFKLVKRGSNNFTCLVVRNPEKRFEPACLNEEAMRSIFPTYELHMALREKGMSDSQALEEIRRQFEDGQLPTAETASLVYMMSANNRGYNPETESLEEIPPHQMYFFPKLADETFRLGGGPPWLWQGYPHLSSLIVVTESSDKFEAGPQSHSH